MRAVFGPAAAGVLALLAACGEKQEGEGSGNGAGNGAAAANAQVSAEGKSEEGKLTIKAPGFDVALSIPAGMAKKTRAQNDSKVIYPGSRIGGIYVAAGENGGSEVEMRFATDAAPDQVAAWYRDPARKEGFALEGLKREGAGYVVTGTQTRDKHNFRAQLSPAGGGGTEGRVLIRHDGEG
ncbi:MAG TPA: hypothetical protein VGB62_02400 [Allosphingosinicella sp.]|jgi:hypothetical protein